MSKKTKYYYDPEQDALVRDEFTDATAARIRQLYAQGASQRELERMFHISRKKVKGIVEGRTWKTDVMSE